MNIFSIDLENGHHIIKNNTHLILEFYSNDHELINILNPYCFFTSLIPVHLDAIYFKFVKVKDETTIS